MSIRVEAGVSYEIVQLEAAEILSRLLELEAKLAPAFAKASGEILAIDALVLATEGKASVFEGRVGGIPTFHFVVEGVKYPRKYVLNILAYAGKTAGFHWFWQELKNWAKAENFDEIRGYGTAATERLAERNFGFKAIYRVYAVPLR